MSTDRFTHSPPHANGESRPDMRAQRAYFSLIELPPQLVVEGVMLDSGYLAEDVTPVGTMRETCPYCDDEPLQLVLQTSHVRRHHLFCQKCTRCFDAFYPNGNSALLLPAVPID